MHLDSSDFYRLWNDSEPKYTAEGLMIGNYNVMYTWEKPLMKTFARLITESHGDILEVGFGMGISAEYIQQFGVRSHTILEVHPQISEAAQKWKETHDTDIHIINDLWQNQVDNLGQFDAIFYDSYSPDDSIEKDTFTFFKLAATRLLREGGKLAFWYPGNTLAENYQQELLKHFRCLQLYAVHQLHPTEECRQRGLSNTMIVPVAYK